MADPTLPVYIYGSRAVYKIDGWFEVHFNGAFDAEPFRTFDQLLAELVCDAWEEAKL